MPSNHVSFGLYPRCCPKGLPPRTPEPQFTISYPRGKVELQLSDAMAFKTWIYPISTKISHIFHYLGSASVAPCVCFGSKKEILLPSSAAALALTQIRCAMEEPFLNNVKPSRNIKESISFIRQKVKYHFKTTIWSVGHEVTVSK